MDELKPCPFCGGKAKKCSNNYHGVRMHSVICTSCKCGTTDFGYINHAIETWNRRIRNDRAGSN